MMPNVLHVTFLLLAISSLQVLVLEADARAEQVSFTIIGTRVERNEQGLPTRLEGTIHLNGGEARGPVIGTYAETVTPIFGAMNNLIGTNGISTFHFHGNGCGQPRMGTVITRNVSKIVGESGGAMLVESSGQVTGGGGSYLHRQGSMQSRSRIVLGPDFSLQANVVLNVEETPAICYPCQPRLGSLRRGCRRW